jgi:hypothetical protein
MTTSKGIVTCMSDSRRDSESDIGFIGHLQIVITSNCNSLTELRTPNITVTTADINYSQPSLAVAW